MKRLRQTLQRLWAEPDAMAVVVLVLVLGIGAGFHADGQRLRILPCNIPEADLPLELDWDTGLVEWWTGLPSEAPNGTRFEPDLDELEPEPGVGPI